MQARGLDTYSTNSNYPLHEPVLHHHQVLSDSSMSSNSAGVYSRDDYSQWKTHNEQFTFTNNTRDYQLDGKGRRHRDVANRRKTSTPSSGAPAAAYHHYSNNPSTGNRPTRGEMLVGGTKLPLRSAISQPPIMNHRRDEMVTPTATSKIHLTSNNKRHIYQRSHSQTPYEHQHYNQQQHMSRAQQYDNFIMTTTGEMPPYHNSERKRSVSPQMERKSRISSSSSSNYIASSSPTKTVEEPSKSIVIAKKKSAKKHIKVPINLTLQEIRHKTFKLEPRWPKSQLLTGMLASFGFYYTGQEDIVKCFSCCVKISDWNNEGDEVLGRHFEEQPNCLFLRSEYHVDIEAYCSKSTKYNIFTATIARERSFTNWPIPRQVNITDLVTAGWFYTGKDVITQCFTCGCRYEEWKKGDNPLTIHGQLSEKCSFLKSLQQAQAIASPMISNVIDFSSFECRLQSFKLLPLDCPLTKEELASAGFYLISTQPMRVKCWSCDLKIESAWVKGDDPLRVHKLMRPTCIAITEGTQTQHSKELLEEDEEDLESFPPPFMSQTQLVKKFSTQRSSSLPQHTSKDTEKEEYHSSMGSNVFNAPVYLPPGLKGMGYTQSLTYKESLSPSHSLTSEEDKLCVVCLDNPKEYAIVPCGHLCVCHSCSLQLVFCPICRIEKEEALRIFDS